MRDTPGPRESTATLEPSSIAMPDTPVAHEPQPREFTAFMTEQIETTRRIMDAAGLRANERQ
jgi:hypothetical protein